MISFHSLKFGAWVAEPHIHSGLPINQKIASRKGDRLNFQMRFDPQVYAASKNTDSYSILERNDKHHEDQTVLIEHPILEDARLYLVWNSRID